MPRYVILHLSYFYGSKLTSSIQCSTLLLTDTFCFSGDMYMINVINCGHNSHHPKPCNIEHKNGVPNYLALLVKQESWFFINNCKQIVPPNSFICFPPNTYIHYGCDKIGYNDDWIHFLPDEKEQGLFKTLFPPMCQVLHPYNFHRLSEYVRLLSDTFYSASLHRQELLHSFMQIFLYALQEELEKNFNTPIAQKYYQSFSELRTHIYNNPANSWCIPELADSTCLSLSYFQHLYKEFFNCSCQQDIINARLELAKYYLTDSDITIRDLAAFCGYENELHFMRQFKKFAGLTPTQYRQSTKTASQRI